MHGFGASGDDLVPSAREIPARARFVFPEAPVSLPREFGGGKAWWHIDILRLQMAFLGAGQTRDLTREVPEGLAPARQRVLQMLSDMRESLALGTTPIYLGGFSQGAMLACDVALRSEEPLAGLILMSGTLLCEDEWLPLMSKRAGLRVVMSHGRQDPLLPFGVAERMRDELTNAGLPVKWVAFDGGHGITPGVLDAVGAMIKG
jgi:phospholipase/carboxylesterase